MPAGARGLAALPGSAGLWRAVFAALVVVVCVLAFAPAAPQALSTGWDKLNHLAAFGTLAIAARLGFRGPRAPAAIVAGLVAFGAIIEIVQAFVPGRESELGDLVADSVGIAAGLLVSHALGRVRAATTS